MNTKWTPKLKRIAAKELLDTANGYEVRQRKSLRNIRYHPNGSAKWTGQAHDYTVWIDQLEKPGLSKPSIKKHKTMAIKKKAARKPAAKKTATKATKKAPARKKGLRSYNPYAGYVCVATNPDGSKSITTPNASSAITCPNGGVLVKRDKILRADATKVLALNAPARRKKPSVKKACRTLVPREGVKADGTLKKGYKYAKGGRVVKAKSATRTKAKKR